MANTALITLVSLVLLLTVVNTGFVLNSVPSAKEIAQNVQLPATQTVQYNDTALKNAVADVKNIVNKDNAWKTVAQNLASSEWADRNNKDVFNFMVDQNISIEEKSDISSIVIKDQDVTSFDADEKDADVTQELKVYYEDSDGDKKKLYINVDTVIEDGEVDSQEFDLA